MQLQLLKAQDYWTQLKDIDSPYNECNVTSGANWLNAMGIYPYTGAFRLPDIIDDVADGFCGRALMRSIAPDYKGFPREIHAVLAWAINVVAGGKIDAFQESVPMATILSEVALNKKPVIVAGKFTSAGHVVCITGIVTASDSVPLASPGVIDVNNVETVLIADPYGDWHRVTNGEHYSPLVSGYASQYTVNELSELLYGDANGKWAHIFCG